MNPPQVACIGDTHLISTHWRNKDRLDAFDAAIAAGRRLPSLQAWVHMGDVFHAVSSPEDRNAVADRFEEMATDAPVLVVEGNHGKTGDTSIYHRLRSHERILVVTEPSLVEVGGILFAVLPYPSKAAMVAAGSTREAQTQIAHDAFDLIAMDATGKRWQEWVGPKMLVGHLTIRGAVTSVGQPLIGAELEMDPLTLARYGNVPKVFGHIHKHQRVNDAIYVGSSCRMDWGETERKGWVLIDFKRSEAGQPLRSVYDYDWTFNELPVPPMYHVQGALNRDAFAWEVRKGPDGPNDVAPHKRIACWKCLGQKPPELAKTGSLFDDVEDITDPDAQPVGNFIYQSTGCTICNGTGSLVDWTGCDVRIRAKYPQSEKLLHDETKKRLATIFPNARYCEVELVAVPTRELRAPEVAAAVGVEEKLKAMARLDGTQWTDDVERCSALLLSTEDGDAVVELVKARLEPLAQL